MTDVGHIKGVDNVPADALSRIDALPSEQPPVLYTSFLTNLQVDDAELRH